MKIGAFTTTNAKGQIVIPKAIRENLSLTKDTPLQVSLQGKSIIIQPVIVNSYVQRGKNQILMQILKNAKGSWENEDFSWIKKRRKIELAASKKRKKAW